MHCGDWGNILSCPEKRRLASNLSVLGLVPPCDNLLLLLLLLLLIIIIIISSSSSSSSTSPHPIALQSNVALRLLNLLTPELFFFLF